MSRPRVVIPIVVQFSIRYLLRTGLLSKMMEYTEPVVLLRWNDASLIQEIRAMGVAIHILPVGDYGLPYLRLKRQLDSCHLRNLQSPSTAIKREIRFTINPPTLRQRARDAYLEVQAAIPGQFHRLKTIEHEYIEKYTNVQIFRALLANLKADAILSFTPYFHQEQLLLVAAKQLGLHLLTSIISFDNITTRGWIPIIFHEYCVWNRFNKAELIRAYPEVNPDSVHIIGAPQFDFYWDNTYLWSETDWRRQLQLPLERPIILYGAGHPTFLPHEPRWVQQLDEAISSEKIPSNPLLLLRLHPNDIITRWTELLNSSKNIKVEIPWQTGTENPALTNISRIDIEKLTSTLAHTAVHINACSTMAIDGSIFDKPQIGPGYDDGPNQKYDRITKLLYLQEHYLPITQSQGLVIASTKESLVAAVIEGLENPQKHQINRQAIVEQIITFNDGKATERLNAKIIEFLKICVG